MAVGGPGLGPSREGRRAGRGGHACALALPGATLPLPRLGLGLLLLLLRAAGSPISPPPLPGAAWPRGGLATSGNEREHSSEGHTKNFYSSVNYVNLSSPVSAWRRQTLRCSLRRGKRRGDRGDRPTSQDSNRLVVFP